MGVLHRIPDSLACNWKSAFDKVLRYATRAMAGRVHGWGGWYER